MVEMPRSFTKIKIKYHEVSLLVTSGVCVGGGEGSTRKDEIPTHSHISTMKTIIYGEVMGRSFIYFSLDVKQQSLTHSL